MRVGFGQLEGLQLFVGDPQSRVVVPTSHTPEA